MKFNYKIYLFTKKFGWQFFAQTVNKWQAQGYVNFLKRSNEQYKIVKI